MEPRRAMSERKAPDGARRLRYPVFVVIFLALTMENPAEAPAMGLWKSPLYPLGEVLFLHLNLVFPGQGWLIFSGFDALLVCLLAGKVQNHSPVADDCIVDDLRNAGIHSAA